ncbi:ATP-binding protein [Nocardioides insulae]|uniref:ATP-binding protein n=1 Tax=Nocardioides insulae TaxID=394734 RepID=UPI0003FA118D|nr:ATP-binding protein [Nocardioides insulae]
MILTPPLIQWLLIEEDLLAVGANLDGLVLAPTVLVAAAGLFVARRLRPDSLAPWILAAVTAIGIKAVGLAGMQLSGEGLTTNAHRWLGVVDLAFVCCLIGLAALNRRPWFAAMPVVWGLVLGLTASVARGLVLRTDLLLRDGPPERVVQCAAIVGLISVLGLAVYRSSRHLPEVCRCLVAGVALFGLTRLLQAAGPGDPVLAMFAVISAALAGGALLEASGRALRASLAAQQEGARALEDHVAQIELEGRTHRTQLHEIESAVIGVVRAHELIRRSEGVTEERRNRLELMIDDELGRLERLLQQRDGILVPAGIVPQPTEQPVAPAAVMETAAEKSVSTQPSGRGGEREVDGEEFDLDRTLSTLATAHEAKGTPVTWHPTGQRLRGHCDELAEVLNILLDNAARHARSGASVAVEEKDESVEILVSDSGPGVDPDLRERLFQFGEHAPGSPGQGIGLHHASALMSQVGGYLRLGDQVEGRGGATFVVGLPRAS